MATQQGQRRQMSTDELVVSYIVQNGGSMRVYDLVRATKRRDVRDAVRRLRDRGTIELYKRIGTTGRASLFIGLARA